MSPSRRLPVTEIPRDICDQEPEIESMFRSLIRFGDSASLRHAQGWSNDALKQEVTAWILIVVLGFLCLVGFYIFWLKAGGTADPIKCSPEGLFLGISDRATETFIDLRTHSTVLRPFRNRAAIFHKQAHTMKRIHLTVITVKKMERKRDTMYLNGVRCSFSLFACVSSELSAGVSIVVLSAGLDRRASTNSGPMWKHIREPLV
jgi:hypothetical protein